MEFPSLYPPLFVHQILLLFDGYLIYFQCNFKLQISVFTVLMILTLNHSFGLSTLLKCKKKIILIIKIGDYYFYILFRLLSLGFIILLFKL